MNKTKLFILLIVIGSFLSSQAVFGEELVDINSYQSLVADKKAFRKGDTLTVIVVEAARAESRAGTGSEHGTQFSAGSQENAITRSGSVNVGGSSGGDAVTSRHGFLSAQLAVSVIEINENGLLKVAGEQTIAINGEEQKINISGTVRKEDISKENTVLSNRLTNAHIEFSGEGVVAKAQDTSIIYQIFQWMGLI